MEGYRSGAYNAESNKRNTWYRPDNRLITASPNSEILTSSRLIPVKLPLSKQTRNCCMRPLVGETLTPRAGHLDRSPPIGRHSNPYNPYSVPPPLPQDYVSNYHLQILHKEFLNWKSLSMRNHPLPRVASASVPAPIPISHRPNRVIFVSKIETEEGPLSQEMLEDIFRRCGTVECIYITLNKTGANFYAIVQMASSCEATRAVQMLDNTEHFGARIRVAYSTKPPQPIKFSSSNRSSLESSPATDTSSPWKTDDEGLIGASRVLLVTNIAISNIPLSRETITKIFERCGEVERAYIRLNKYETGYFAIVQMATVDDAARAMQMIDNTIHHGCHIKVVYSTKPPMLIIPNGRNNQFGGNNAERTFSNKPPKVFLTIK